MYAVCIIFSKANTACIDEVHSWMWSNRLQLNVNKSELLSATARWQHQLPTCTIRIGPDTITPSTAVRDLGIYIDLDLSMQTHVQRSVAGCFAVLCQLCSIWRLVPSTVYQSLVTALVLPRLDRRRRSRASPVLAAIGLAYGNPVYLTPHRIDVP